MALTPYTQEIVERIHTISPGHDPSLPRPPIDPLGLEGDNAISTFTQEVYQGRPRPYKESPMTDLFEIAFNPDNYPGFEYKFVRSEAEKELLREDRMNERVKELASYITNRHTLRNAERYLDPEFNFSKELISKFLKKCTFPPARLHIVQNNWTAAKIDKGLFLYEAAKAAPGGPDTAIMGYIRETLEENIKNVALSYNVSRETMCDAIITNPHCPDDLKVHFTQFKEYVLNREAANKRRDTFIDATNSQEALVQLFLNGSDLAIMKVTSQELLFGAYNEEPNVARKGLVLSKISDPDILKEIINGTDPVELRKQASNNLYGPSKDPQTFTPSLGLSPRIAARQTQPYAAPGLNKPERNPGGVI